jgi:ABC-type Zn uptake system ZnuABC Zn-binding protein ZnuA
MLTLCLLAVLDVPVHAAPLGVCATVPDLGALAREVGGEEVSVVVFAKGTEDPHFVEARPSFVKDLSRADLLVVIGLDFEIGYLPVLLQSARNPRVLRGARGHLDASQAIDRLEQPAAAVDRSMGDVHPYGNPHYLLDPLAGLRVARLIAARLAELRPEKREYFETRAADFARRLGTALVGETLARTYDPEKLATLAEHGKLDAFLREQGREDQLAGWLGEMRPYHGAKVVDDHNLWPYFARRFGLEVIGHMEPKPGITPTTRHLSELIEQIRAERVQCLLAAAYYDPRHARFLAAATGIPIAEMANQVGARPGTDDYLAFVDYNVRQVAGALGRSARGLIP